MKASERAAQLWAVLALAARNRQVLTYDLVAQLTGVARQGLGPIVGADSILLHGEELAATHSAGSEQGNRASERWVHRSRCSGRADGAGSSVRAGLAVAWLPNTG